MLGYRSHFTVAAVSDNQPLTAAALHQARSWLRYKGYDADAVEFGQTVKVAEHAEVALAEVRAQDGSLSTMFLLQEHTPRGDWTSRLIVHESAHERRDPWLWLDIVSPDDAPFTARPRLTQYLLEVLDGRDGGSQLDPRVRRTTADDVPHLLDALRDPRRRGLVFVAGSDETLPMEPWQKLVGDLLRETTGLAAGYVLDAEATREFNARAGLHHSVPAGTMRTYVRGVELNNPLDARRHRYLGTEQIVTRRAESVRRVLGARAREIALAQPLPTQALRVESLLLAQADRDFFSARKFDSLATASATTGQGEPARSAAVYARPFTSEPLAATEGPTPPPDENPALPTTPDTASSSIVNVEAHLALVSALSSILGTAEVTPATIDLLREKAAEAEALRAAVHRKTNQYESQTVDIARLREARAEDRKRLEDEQLEHAATRDELEDARTEAKALRRRLSAIGQHTDAQRPVTEYEAEPAAPESFADLLERIEDLDAIVWTGDSKKATDLDAHNPLGLWAGKTWEMLLALQDYAVERAADRAINVDHYLMNTPPHLHGYPANRHAPDESETVKTTKKFSRVRFLPVPRHVDTLGKVFMGAHFKIAQYGIVSPRLHYVDNVHGDGKIYVGYIGPHLPTGNTN